MRRIVLFALAACAPPVPGRNPVDPQHDYDGDGLNELGGDCDDVDPDVGAPFDQYPDADGDGLPAAAPVSACPGAGATTPGTDCDDADAEVDDGLERFTDADGDGYGTGALVSVGCTAPSGFVEQDGDCDDANPDAFPGGDDRCWTPSDESCGTDPASCRLDGDVPLSQGAELSLPMGVGSGRVSVGYLDGGPDPDVAVGAAGGSLLRITLGGPDPTEIDVRTALVVPETQGLLLAFGGDAETDVLLEGYDPGSTNDPPLLWMVYDAPTSGVVDADVLGTPIDLPPAVGLTSRGGYALAAGDLDGLADGDDLVLTGPSYEDGSDWLLVLPGQDAPAKGEPLSLTAHGVVARSDDETIHGLGDDVVIVPDLGGTGDRGLALVSHGDGVDGIELVVFEADDVLDRQDLTAPWGWWETGEQAPSLYDPASVTVGDVDLDGALDLVVGVPALGGLGAAYVLLGPSPTNPAVPLATVATRLEGDEEACGTAVAIVDDLFGPSTPGIAVGCPTSDGGAVHLLPGELAQGNVDLDDAPAHVVQGTTGAVYVGWTLAAAGGDFDGDLGGDLVVGVDGQDLPDGPDAYVLSGGLE